MIRHRSASNRLALFLLLGGLPIATIPAAPTPAKVAFVFQGVNYFHRWSQATQHEFTPAKQEDLEKWSDMITLNGYPSVQDGEGLAATANSVLENYQKAKGKILRTDSVPRTDARPAEHFIAVLFVRANFAEVAFARFTILDGTGYSIVYSHRWYGEDIAEKAGAWIEEKGEATEQALMEWDNPPEPEAFRQTAL